MKVLIVGGVAGGASAAARLRRLDEKAEIILFEKGEYISFANCGLPYYIGGEIEQQSALTLQTPQSFRRRFNIDVRVRNEVVGLDTQRKCVKVRDLKDGSEYQESYDELILSPGAAPIIPPLEGVEDERVFTLRSIPDSVRIKNHINQAHPASAAVIGGGYIGVEMAENLAKAGVNVTIVEMADHLIAPLDVDMAAEVHRYIQDQGVGLMLKNGVQAIEPGKDGLKLRLSKGQLKADMVILSVGVRPDTALNDPEFADSLGLADPQEIDEGNCCVLAALDHTAVSYTHLDVYKRQNELCTRAEMVYFITPQERAMEEFGFCGCKTEDEH